LGVTKSHRTLYLSEIAHRRLEIFVFKSARHGSYFNLQLRTHHLARLFLVFVVVVVFDVFPSCDSMRLFSRCAIHNRAKGVTRSCLSFFQPCANRTRFTAVSRKVVRQNRTRQWRNVLWVMGIHGP